jgi:hypothetical protein
LKFKNCQEQHLFLLMTMSTVFEKPLSAVDAHDQEMAQENLELLESQAPIDGQ